MVLGGRSNHAELHDLASLIHALLPASITVRGRLSAGSLHQSGKRRRPFVSASLNHFAAQIVVERTIIACAALFASPPVMRILSIACSNFSILCRIDEAMRYGGRSVCVAFADGLLHRKMSMYCTRKNALIQSSQHTKGCMENGQFGQKPNFDAQPPKETKWNVVPLSRRHLLAPQLAQLQPPH
jgi:hypothetical protein